MSGWARRQNMLVVLNPILTEGDKWDQSRRPRPSVLTSRCGGDGTTSSPCSPLQGGRGDKVNPPAPLDRGSTESSIRTYPIKLHPRRIEDPQGVWALLSHAANSDVPPTRSKGTWYIPNPFKLFVNDLDIVRKLHLFCPSEDIPFS